MLESVVVNKFRREQPGLKIRDKIVDAKERKQFQTQKSDATRARVEDPCACVIARGEQRAFRVPSSIVLKHFTYLLEPCGGDWYQAVKYMHDAPSIVDNLDNGGLPVWRTLVTLRPPGRAHSVGAKAATKRTPSSRAQSREHVEKRAASNRGTSVRLSRLSA